MVGDICVQEVGTLDPQRPGSVTTAGLPLVGLRSPTSLIRRGSRWQNVNKSTTAPFS